MPVSIESMRTPPTRDQMFDSITALLSGLGFQLTDWTTGSIQRTMLLGFSSIAADFASVISQVANFGFNSYALGAALREYSRSSYGNEPGGAVKTKGPITFTSTAGSAYTVEVGQLLMTTPNGVQFRSIQAGTIPAGGTAQLNVEAVLAGSSGNVPNGSISILQTPLAGVTISNPDSGSGIWYTTSGADPESPSKLRARNTAKWGTLNQVAMTSDGYRSLALSIPAITRVYVDDQNPRGPNSIDIYCATATGPASGAELSAVQALFDVKHPPGADPLALAPVLRTQDVYGTVHIRTAMNTPAKRAAIDASVRAYINSLDIGGAVLPPSTTRVMPYSEVVGAITAKAGVVGVHLTMPTTDVALAPIDLVVPGVVQLEYVSA